MFILIPAAVQSVNQSESVQFNDSLFYLFSAKSHSEMSQRVWTFFQLEWNLISALGWHSWKLGHVISNGLLQVNITEHILNVFKIPTDSPHVVVR